MTSITGILKGHGEPTGRRALAYVWLLLVKFAPVGSRAVAKVKPNVLTVAALACFDVGAFEANHIVGWVITGLSLLALDWKLDSGE